MIGILERGHRGLRRAAMLGGTVAAFAAVSAAPAHAAFTLPTCGGGAVNGEGASFQATAQNNWKLNFGLSVCPGLVVSYNPSGSGAGRRAMGERTGANADGSQSRLVSGDRFGSTDDPLTATGRTQIEEGTGTASDGDENAVHEIPVASGAVAIIVNWPDHCLQSAPGVPTANQSDPGNSDNRVQFTKTQVEAIWNGGTDADTWGDIFPALAGDGTLTDAQCRALPMIRVKRFDDSGTTYALKSYLNTINPGRGWITTYEGPNTNWPNPGPNLLDGGANGNGPLADTVNSHDGSIGYGDLATVRSKNFSLDATTTDTTYWIPVQNGSNTYTDPASDPTSFKTLSNPTKGSNCTTTTYTQVPTAPADLTFGDWSKVQGVNSASGYGICTLTYSLAFDDDAKAYSAFDPTAEQAKARTVKDYLSYIVSDAGQAVLQPNDYTALPLPILAASRTGVNAIGWNKAGDTGGGGGGGGGAGGGGGGAGGGGGGNVTAPSNTFTVSSASVSKSGKVSVRVQLPGPGNLVIKVSGKSTTFGKHKAKTIAKAGSASTATLGGVTVLTFSPTSAVKTALKNGQKVKLTIKITFTPAGGSANTLTKTLTLKPKKVTKKH
jgi:ABC-type phosphate transport system substrate-binding protein